MTFEFFWNVDFVHSILGCTNSKESAHTFCVTHQDPKKDVNIPHETSTHSVRLHNDPLDVDGGLPSHIAKEYNINNSAILAKSKDFINAKDLNRKISYKIDNTNHIKQSSPVDFTINHNKFTQGIDLQDQNVGVKTNLDNIKMDTNPMSSSWKGHDSTDKAIEMGEFDGQKRANNWIQDELKLRHVQCENCKK